MNLERPINAGTQLRRGLTTTPPAVSIRRGMVWPIRLWRIQVPAALLRTTTIEAAQAVPYRTEMGAALYGPAQTARPPHSQRRGHPSTILLVTIGVVVRPFAIKIY